MLLTAAFAVTGRTVVKPNGTYQNRQKKFVKPDPLGTIDGATNPEMIPDHVAYMLIFRTIATPQGTDFEKARSRAWAKFSGLDEGEAYKLIEAANEFVTQVKPLDQQAHEIKNRSWPNPDASVMAQLTALQARKEALVANIITSLPNRLGELTAEKLHQHVSDNLKRKMKIAPVSANPIGRHH